MHPPIARHRAQSVVEFAKRHMGTADVRLDPKLNQQIWSQGVKNVPHRLRLKLERRRNDDEGAKEKLYTYASWVPVDTFKVCFPFYFIFYFLFCYF